MSRSPAQPTQVLIANTVCAACAAAIFAVTESGMEVDFQPGVAQSATNSIGDASAKQALDALREMLTAYENSDATKVESRMLPTLVGLTTILKSIQDSHTQQREIRTHLQNIGFATNSEDVLISADWEKRYLTTAGLVPGLAKGRATFVFRLISGQWKLAGMTGNSLFAGGL